MHDVGPDRHGVQTDPPYPWMEMLLLIGVVGSIVAWAGMELTQNYERTIVAEQCHDSAPGDSGFGC